MTLRRWVNTLDILDKENYLILDSDCMLWTVNKMNDYYVMLTSIIFNVFLEIVIKRYFKFNGERLP